MIDPRVERLLAQAAAETVYPLTPAFEERVREALSSAPERRRAFVLAPAAIGIAALLAIVAFVAADGAGDAVARFFGVKGSSIERLPPPPEGVAPTAEPTPVGIEYLGGRTTLDAARAALNFAPPLPAGSGEPIAVYRLDVLGLPVIVLEYPSFDLWIARPGQEVIFAKGLPAGTTLHEFTLNGHGARWVSDGFHVLTFRAASGREATGFARTVTRNTLIWATDTAFYRLETSLELEAAIAIARTLP
ncbi:MAG TPA: hypothetical protein VNN10_01920 [Dehalococcoidia bacterium]|nr:hypothetical protein [Dehalococcoidia bacterium]